MKTNEINDILENLYNKYLNKEINISEIFNLAKIQGITDLSLISNWIKDRKCL